jgi:predicted ATPase
MHARAICAELGNTANVFPVLWGLARFYLVRTPLEMSRALGEDMMRLAEHEQDPDLLLQAHNSLGATLFHMGECAAALVHFDRALALYDTRRHHTHVTQYVQDPAVVCLSRSSLALWSLGDPDQAVRRAREGIALAESEAHSFSLAFALAFVAMLHEFRRDFAAARQLAERAIDLSAREGFSVFVVMGTLIRGTAIAELGDLETGIAQIRSGMKAADAAGTRLLRPYSLGLLARACGQSGNPEEGLAMVGEGLETAAATGEHFYDAELHRIEGELLLRSPRADARARAEASLRTAIGVAERQHARSWRLRAATTLGELGGGNTVVRRRRAA